MGGQITAIEMSDENRLEMFEELKALLYTAMVEQKRPFCCRVAHETIHGPDGRGHFLRTEKLGIDTLYMRFGKAGTKEIEFDSRVISMMEQAEMH